MAYQVFISYRREGGDHVAKLINERLINKGYSVFYDRDSLHGGYFDDRIFEAIEECKDFILVLPKGSLDKCVNDDDWVRAEIRHAIKHNKNIIPVMIDGFTFPKNLPSDIAAISRINGVKYSIDYFDAVMNAIITDRMMSLSKKIDAPSYHPSQNSSSYSHESSQALKTAIIVILIVAVVGVSVFLFSLSSAGKQVFCSHSYVSTTTEPTCVDVGYTTYTCPKCNKVKTDDYKTELGHTWGESTQIKAPSCTENGTQYRECLACDYHEQIPILATGHTYSDWIVDKEATNTENGARHTLCITCNERIDEIIYSAGSKGIKYEKSGDHYIVTSIGGCRDTHIVIASTIDGYPVTEIANGAFKNSDIESIIIPEGIVSIGDKAFYECKKLSKISMPKSLKTIGKKAFFRCDSLTSVVLPEGVTKVANEAFRMCVNLTSITFPKNIESIGIGCFTDCWQLTEVTYENTVDAWKNVKVGLLAFNTGRFILGGSTTIYCTDGTVKK